MNLKQLLRLRLATKIAKSARNDTLFKLIMDILNSNSPLAPGGGGDGGEGEYSSRLADIFSDYPITQYSEVYASVLATIRRIYTPAKILPPHQQQSLAETVYQRSLNLFHLAEYAARGTRYVQVSAIMDSRTTPQCRQMNGRIFALPTLSREASNQHELVKSDDYWANAAYFRGVPTPDIVPSLPPYHYNCRTRIVPYIRPEDPFRALRDDLENYTLTPDSLPPVRTLTSSLPWNSNSLSQHYEKHLLNFSSARDYDVAARKLLSSPKASIALLTAVSDNHMLVLAWQSVLDSKSQAYFLSVFDLTTQRILTFHKKRYSQILRQLQTDSANKIIFLQNQKETS